MDYTQSVSIARTIPHIKSARFSPTLSCFGRFPKQPAPLSVVPVSSCVRCVADSDDDDDDCVLPLQSPPAAPRALPRTARPPLTMRARAPPLEGSRATFFGSCSWPVAPAAAAGDGAAAAAAGDL